jgi:enoyl-CoA hydratase
VKGLRIVELIKLELRSNVKPDSGNVAVVTLNDAPRRNVLSSQLVKELVETMDAIADNPDVGAVVITGAPPAFCAGADLKDLAIERGRAAQEPGQTDSGLRSIYQGFLCVAESRLPTVAAVNGAAIGAGFNLALACDVRIAGESARFESRFLDIGLHPGGGHTFLLQKAVGRQAAAAMVLFGQSMSGRDAATNGLVWSCVDDAQLLEVAIQIAMRSAVAPKGLSMRVKETLGRTSALNDLKSAVDLEIEAQMWSLGEPFSEQ